MAHPFADKNKSAARAAKIASGGSDGYDLPKWSAYAKSNSNPESMSDNSGVKPTTTSKGYTAGADTGMGRMQRAKKYK